MKRFTLTLFAVALTFGIFAQDFEIPQNYKLEKAEDYAGYEKNVIACFNWLMDSPLNKETTKRKEANAFLLKWMSGSPNVHLEIKAGIVTFMDNADLLMIFMGGWTKYSLESKDFDDKVAGNKAGIEAVIEFYTKNKDVIGKDKNVEKYIKMKEKGKFDEYIKNNA
jgi:hypothetical protein